MLAQIGYSIILAVSLNLVVGFLGELSLGHAGFMCAGAYIGCFTANYLHTVIPDPTVVLILSMIVGGLTAALFGFIIGLPTLRLKGDYLAIVTLAFGEIIRTVFMNQEVFGGALGLTTRKYGKTLFVIVFVMALFTVFVTQNLMKSKHGRAIQAIRDNEIAARAMGVNVTYYKLAVFVIAAFFAGIAGVLYGHNTTPVDYGFFSFNYSVEILVMVVLGGMGNITGSILSATVLTFINIQLTTKLSGDLAALKYLIYALILIVAVIWNNAPALSKVRERFGLRRLVEYIIIKIRGHRIKEEGGMEAPSTADWSKVPTKIPMDALLSTDVIPEQSIKEEGDKK
ncbi:MAG: branched-chain amino acid ABC transporter permease [Clostridia bacterium]|nr:branched-chain amino acid ABC transporter permease [Clostridia bacterium]